MATETFGLAQPDRKQVAILLDKHMLAWLGNAHNAAVAYALDHTEVVMMSLGQCHKLTQHISIQEMMAFQNVIEQASKAIGLDVVHVHVIEGGQDA